MSNESNQTFSQAFSWKIGAPAGFGVMTVGMLMAKLTARHGLTVAGYPEYPSLIQGGHNTFEVTMGRQAAGAENTLATKQDVDCLVCLTEETLPLHAQRLHAASLVVYDPSVLADIGAVSARPVPIPLAELQTGLKADKLMINTIAFGASAALLGADRQLVLKLIADQFRGKAAAITEINQTCVSAGYDYVTKHFAQEIKPVLSAVSTAQPLISSTDQLVMTGNEAFSLAAIAADCRLYVSYPMTPTSAVLEILAGYQITTGMVVKQAEDEIAVIAQALGASFAGARAAVGTSGGGFALMVEHISYAGVAEIPLVILLGQRPGPATGLPTWTEQGDLLFAVHAGHGEFPKIVLAPGDLDEIAELTVKAFDLADRYQTPVIILTDKFSAESHRSVTAKAFEELRTNQPDRGKLLRVDQEVTTDAASKYLRYSPTDDGISPRLVPGTAGQFYQANSYEHLEDSHTTEAADERIKQVDKRARKMETYLEKDWAEPSIYGDLTDSQLVMVTWGSQKIPARAAQLALVAEGIHTALIHFTHLYPLNDNKLHDLFDNINQPLLLIENNATGQFARLLREEADINIASQLNKYDGRPFFQQEIIAAVKKQLSTT